MGSEWARETRRCLGGDSASERTVVAHGGDGDGKDLADENPFDDFESGRQERALREHETGRSQGQGRF